MSSSKLSNKHVTRIFFRFELLLFYLSQFVNLIYNHKNNNSICKHQKQQINFLQNCSKIVSAFCFIFPNFLFVLFHFLILIRTVNTSGPKLLQTLIRCWSRKTNYKSRKLFRIFRLFVVLNVQTCFWNMKNKNDNQKRMTGNLLKPIFACLIFMDFFQHFSVSSFSQQKFSLVTLKINSKNRIVE